MASVEAIAIKNLVGTNHLRYSIPRSSSDERYSVVDIPLFENSHTDEITAGLRDWQELQFEEKSKQQGTFGQMLVTAGERERERPQEDVDKTDNKCSSGREMNIPR
eukprot:CAMPEP_0201181462 /NCGR_PEP_ID=MMETSP0851-20130426/118866_1 /ASSEMBLY_ACC=CAM_ASM_000631 /TAXON_ID=183588 /ORGANISM="Pseudo-nitzschia fraudulenta, Strain WWA7" /LENGTH=105 /DNA_ID=CAMNT_0047465833 /DNA_START=362 /DNA_END=679 /DNA_ORIENTATION=-